MVGFPWLADVKEASVAEPRSTYTFIADARSREKTAVARHSEATGTRRPKVRMNYPSHRRSSNCSKGAETKVAKKLRPAHISPLSSASFAATYSLVSEPVSVTKVFASSANGSLSAPKTRAQLHCAALRNLGAQALL
jgi:hypothetical protein